MLNRKSIAIVALFLVFVFGVTIIAYPLMFNPEASNSPKESPTDMPAAPATL